ncbi:MAG: hypothetical protein KF686_10045 [Ramlibacter sp.]|nr:hypothetical protein [Ramlibacter sp.]
MKRLRFALVFIALCLGASGAGAQNDAKAGDGAERDRIQAERTAANARYERDAVACHARFAVNDCLDEARARRRERLGDLRRQEISLNDAQRRRKGAAQQQRMDEKAALLSQRQADEARGREKAKPSRDARASRPLGPASASGGASAAVTARQDERLRAAKQAQARQSRAEEAAAQARRQRVYVREAQERKQRILKRQQERTQPPARPLPVPP